MTMSIVYTLIVIYACLYLESAKDMPEIRDIRVIYLCVVAAAAIIIYIMRTALSCSAI